MSNLPTFLGIGAMKSGTSSLHDTLAKHPDIFLPAQKELHFFCTDENFACGKEYYSAFFAGAKGKVCGEISPEYLYVPDAVTRARTVLGCQVKVIAMLRNPADRAFSHYHHTKFRAYEDRSFVEAIECEPKRLGRGVRERMRYSYLDRGYYARQLKRWYATFGRQNILVILFETDFLQRTQATMHNLQSFLGVSARDLPLDTHSNQSGKAGLPFVNRLVFRTSQDFRPLYRALLPSRAMRQHVVKAVTAFGWSPAEKLSSEIRAEIVCRYFWDDICELEDLIGRDLSDWKTA